MPRASRAGRQRATVRPATLARAPISTGPVSKPTYPIPATAAIPLAVLPGRALPATDSSCGKMHDKPAPFNAKPTIVTAGMLLISAVAIPIAASNPPPLTSAAGPNRSARRSPARRPTAIVTENAAKPNAANQADVPRPSLRYTADHPSDAPSPSSANSASTPSKASGDVRAARHEVHRAPRGPLASAAAPAASATGSSGNSQRPEI